ncbi:MAG: helix-turn-helix transcriptional regulator [Alphaproteobacteria bacterium]|jgi:DNA-binding CsgD family transcriptional regulator
MKEEKISALIGRIYDCAISPNKWPATLANICEYIESAAGTLAVIDLVTGQEKTLVNYGISEEDHRAYQEKYHCVDLFLHPLMLREIGDPATSADLVSDEELLSSRIYREWAAPQGFRDTLMTMLTRHQGRLAFLGVTRKLEQRRYDAADRHAMRLITPHVQRAVLISDLIEHQTVERNYFARIIDTIATPTVIIESNLRILHTNQTGQAMLSRGIQVSSAKGAIRLPNQVAAAVLRASREASQGRADTVAVPDTLRIVGDGAQSDIIFVVMPLGVPDRKLGSGALQIALFMQEANSFTPLAGEVWGKAFGLTGGELRVLQGLVEGAAPAEIAAMYGIANSTVRTHLVSLFRKTGTRRQVELVRLALSSVPPVRTG